MNINLQAWDNFLGQCLLVFLIIEGLKVFPIIARASRGSLLYKIILNVVVNLIFSFLVRGTGGEMFGGEGVSPFIASVIASSLTTAGLHRLKKAFERRSPSNSHWEAKHGPTS